MGVIIDVALCLVAILFFFLGYRKGFLKKAWWLVDIVVSILLFMALSPSVLNWITENTTWREGLINAFSSLSETIPQLDAATIADFILKAGICIALELIVIIVMLIVKFILKKLITIKFFEILDKLFGGIYSVVVFILVLLVLGGVLGTFVEFAPVQKLNDVFVTSSMAKYLFGQNPLQAVFDKYFPLGVWIKNLIS